MHPIWKKIFQFFWSKAMQTFSKHIVSYYFWVHRSAVAVGLDSNPVKITPIWREDTIPILPNWLLVFHGHEEPIPVLPLYSLLILCTSTPPFFFRLVLSSSLLWLVCLRHYFVNKLSLLSALYPLLFRPHAHGVFGQDDQSNNRKIRLLKEHIRH